MPSLRVAVVCGLALAGLSFFAAPQQADARPQYLREFAKKYEHLKEQAKDAKCTICHFGDKKTNHNDYGLAMEKKLGKKNVKDNDVIEKAFVDIEPEKSKVPKEPGSSEMKTFGELIKENKLPGTNPEEPKPQT